MTMFTCENAWNFTLSGGAANSAINQSLSAAGSAYACRQKLLWNVKNTLVRLGAFEVKGSSNASLSGEADYWNGPSDITWNSEGNAHSWIVLTNVAWGYDILFNCCDQISSSSYLEYKINMAGQYLPLWGTIYNAPQGPPNTATMIAKGNAWIPDNTNNVPYVLHAMGTTDNRTTRLFIMQGGSLYSAFFFETITDLLTPMSIPVAFLHPYSSRTMLCTDWKNSKMLLRFDGGPWVWGGGTWEAAYNGTPLPQLNSGIPNDITGNYCGVPMGLYIQSGGYRGKLARFSDIWVGSNVVAMGDTYPAATPDFAQFGHMILPWAHGVNPVLA